MQLYLYSSINNPQTPALRIATAPAGINDPLFAARTPIIAARKNATICIYFPFLVTSSVARYKTRTPDPAPKSNEGIDF